MGQTSDLLVTFSAKKGEIRWHISWPEWIWNSTNETRLEGVNPVFTFVILFFFFFSFLLTFFKEVRAPTSIFHLMGIINVTF